MIGKRGAATLFTLLIAAGLVVPKTSAQPETTPLVVMNLAAHPDDEDGSTLAYYRHALDAVAYSVIYTRGEGGQNEIGPELYEELGAIRTSETLRAARHLGTQTFFLNFKDFGYSKSAEETFQRWGGEDAVTSRLVYLIRKLKPDVLFTNHDTLTTGADRQHGHHQVVGVTAYKAFTLAADSSYHPDQFEEEGVDPWQPKRLFHRLWNRPDDGGFDVAVPVGRIDRETGISYAEVAAAGLHEHASQGMEMFADYVAGWDSTYFELYRSASDAELSPSDLGANLRPNRTANPDLNYWIDSGRIPLLLDRAVTVDDSLTVPGQRIRISWQFQDLPERPVRLKFFGALDTLVVIRNDSPPSDDFVVDPSHTPTTPSHIYQYERFESRPPLGYAAYDARTGKLLAGGYVAMEIAPPIMIESDRDVMRFEAGDNVVPYRVRVFDPLVDSIIVAAAVSRDADQSALDQRQKSVAAGSSSFLGRESRGTGPAAIGSGVLSDEARLRLPDDASPGAYTVTLSAAGFNGIEDASSSADFLKAQVFDADVSTGLRVGVVESYDNTLDVALTELGVEHVMLDSTDLASASFDGLHTILVDIRAYLVRRDLRMYNDGLLDWVRDGGHLVVNYQKTFEWNENQSDPFDPSQDNPGSFAPYPLELSQQRVTREDAPVTVLQPHHPIVNLPNEVTDRDWKGWVQERGLYFPGSYDSRYQELFSLHDPGEDPLSGSTLLADHGNGTYLYSALVWYRQLKEYHPGAYKLFANMISLPLTDGRTADS